MTTFRFVHGLALAATMLAGAEPSAAQQTAPPPLTVGDVAITGSWRTRAELWEWFDRSDAGTYGFGGSLLRIAATQTRKTIGWQLEIAAPVLLRLPTDAVRPGAAGALGLGANYFVANDGKRNVAGLFVKQAAIQWTGIGGIAGQSLRIGRMEFADGAETTPQQPALAALKRDRIGQRLIGPFGFSHVGRSVDGVRYILNTSAINVTALAARPTRGVFDVNGWDELKINVFSAAVTGRAGDAGSAGDWRAFAIGYQDRRRDVVKTDNRALGVRTADADEIGIATFGGHYIHLRDTAKGAVDLLFWGAAQTGSWGSLTHRAGAFAAEAGWQPRAFARHGVWVRGGYNYGTGDADQDDATHGTFFQLLPTPRAYARLPLYNMMNTADLFASIIGRPVTSMSIRADIRSVGLANARDLWYQGGGAFEATSFGYAGRPSSGHTGLVTLADVSADATISRRVSLTGYYAHAFGRPVAEAIYGVGTAARFGYFELLLRF